jgi:hypothetical protein
MDTEGLPCWSVGSPDGDRLDVFLLGRPEDDGTGDSISALARIRAGAFSGEIRFRTRAAELGAFREAVARLDRDRKGAADLTTMFNHLRVRVETDGRGPVEATGYLKPDPCFGNEFYFFIPFDAARLAETAEGIGEALRRLGFESGRSDVPVS